MCVLIVWILNKNMRCRQIEIISDFIHARWSINIKNQPQLAVRVVRLDVLVFERVFDAADTQPSGQVVGAIRFGRQVTKKKVHLLTIP